LSGAASSAPGATHPGIRPRCGRRKRASRGRREPRPARAPMRRAGSATGHDNVRVNDPQSHLQRRRAVRIAATSALISSIVRASVPFTTESDRMDSTACVNATRSSISKSRENVASDVRIMIAFGLPLAVTRTAGATDGSQGPPGGRRVHGTRATWFSCQPVSCRCWACQQSDQRTPPDQPLCGICVICVICGSKMAVQCRYARFAVPSVPSDRRTSRRH